MYNTSEALSCSARCLRPIVLLCLSASRRRTQNVSGCYSHPVSKMTRSRCVCSLMWLYLCLPHMLAALNGHMTTAQIVVERGGNPNVMNVGDKSALGIATVPSKQEVRGYMDRKTTNKPKGFAVSPLPCGLPLGLGKATGKKPDRKPCSCILQKGHCHRKLIVVVAICCDLPLSSCRFFVALWITPWVGKTMGVNPDRQICSRIVQKGHCLRVLLVVLAICCDLLSTVQSSVSSVRTAVFFRISMDLWSQVERVTETLRKEQQQKWYRPVANACIRRACLQNSQ